jgi:ppGpp synthetase/RelA/SpoT-type nucleotidyltranferase
MSYTGGDIIRLGEKIVQNNGNINEDDLELLQEYRKSFTEPLTSTFNDLTKLKNTVDRQAIIAFRLKRIKTVVNKVIREPKMKLNRMGDIAGIRIILKSEQQVYKLLDLIKSNFEVSGNVRNYIENPKKIGYKGVHIYIKDSLHKKRIEIQIRTIEAHNWATLVEITDLLYKTRLKELGFYNNKELGRLHSLISRDIELSTEEAEYIYKILDKFNFISKLSQLFRKNHNEVKKQWLEVQPRSKYFLIESSSDSIPKLEGFTNYNHAEEEYFKRYKVNQEALIVLTAIHKPTFDQISIAYANYILSYHKFMEDVESILKELALESIEMNNERRFRKIFRIYEELQANTILQIFMEVEGILVDTPENKKIVLSTQKRISTKKKKDLKDKVNAELKRKGRAHRGFMDKIIQIQGKKSIWNLRNRKFLKKHSKRVKKRLKDLTIRFVSN